MTSDDRAFLKQAFQATADEPLEAGDARYVDLSAVRGHEDPVTLMARTIELSAGESVQLFSGFPGTGKTTELRRLQHELTREQHMVMFVDAEEYQRASMPIAAPQILMALAHSAMSAYAPKGMRWPEFLGELSQLTLHQSRGESEDVAAHIKREPSVWRELPSLRGVADSLVNEVRKFFAGWLRKVRDERDDESSVVVLVDSIDHVRGFSTDAATVRASVEALFAQDAAMLAIPGIHIVYTVPPYVRSNSASAGMQHMLPAVTVTAPDGAVDRGGVDALKGLVGRRIDCKKLFGDDTQLERMIRCSGGNVRDLLRLVRESIRRTDALPMGHEAVTAALEQMRAGLHPIARQDAVQLAQIARAHSLTLDPTSSPYDVARWADAHLLHLYRNGREWYDVHPLVRDTIFPQAPEAVAIPSEPDAAPASPKQPRPLAQQAAPVVLTPDMRVTLIVESYRALRRVRWTLPRGVSALVGPNGSGKTTLLDVPELLRHALTHDARRAIDDRGGPGSLRSAQADRHAPVILGVELDHLTWQLDLSPRGAAFNPLHGERATLSGAVALDRSTLEVSPDDARPLLRRFSEQPDGAAFRPLIALLEGYRLYGTYDLASIRSNGSQISSDEHLHPDGRNIFSLLRNWRDRAETRPRWDFVLASLKESFPDTFDDLDFDMAGQTVSGRIVAPQPDVRIPTYFAANGWLIALLHLAAVASTGPAGVVAIDEMENGLHPYAIRALMDAMRGWAAQTGISIVLATHSPVVLDQFKGNPDHVLVMEPGREPLPTRLDELHDPEWLAHFSLGDLYAHDEFGAQHKDGDQVA